MKKVETRTKEWLPAIKLPAGIKQQLKNLAKKQNRTLTDYVRLKLMEEVCCANSN